MPIEMSWGMERVYKNKKKKKKKFVEILSLIEKA